MSSSCCPPEFDPEPGCPKARQAVAAVTPTLIEICPGKVACLSTIGADAPHENLLTRHTLMEQSLQEIGLPATFLRPGWFMENALWDICRAAINVRRVISSRLSLYRHPLGVRRRRAA
ncbi:hypothetical protein ACQZ42_13715 [Rhizobium rhizogenes]